MKKRFSWLIEKLVAISVVVIIVGLCALAIFAIKNNSYQKRVDEQREYEAIDYDAKMRRGCFLQGMETVLVDETSDPDTYYCIDLPSPNEIGEVILLEKGDW